MEECAQKEFARVDTLTDVRLAHLSSQRIFWVRFESTRLGGKLGTARVPRDAPLAARTYAHKYYYSLRITVGI
jgi:hypothetical protein